jgi:hypothetical protein
LALSWKPGVEPGLKQVEFAPAHFVSQQDSRVRLRTLGFGWRSDFDLDFDFDLGFEQRCLVGFAPGSVLGLGLKPPVGLQQAVTERRPKWEPAARAMAGGAME